MNELKKIFMDWIVPIGAALIIALSINKFLFYFISVPTESMYPTIKPGDKIGVTRVYNFDKLKRGDIIVFYSNELKDMLVKRLIGLPNDKVKIDNDGNVYINGKKQNEVYVKQPGGKADMEFEVPKHKYLFLGDNRINSLDARYWKNKFIDQNEIKGKAQFVILPLNRIGKLK